MPITASPYVGFNMGIESRVGARERLNVMFSSLARVSNE